MGFGKKIRCVAVAGTLALTMVGVNLVVSAPAAQAALPTCTDYSIGYGYPPFAPGVTSVLKLPTVGMGTHRADCILQQGNSNTAVRMLQMQLTYCAGENVAIDGIFGPLTRAALVRAQKMYGVSADGIYGPQTRNAMFWPDTGTEIRGGVYCAQFTGWL